MSLAKAASAPTSEPGKYGFFPFGRPNTVRPARMATAPPTAVVVGVYPSAWHVEWWAPGRKGRVAAMAVDVEPTVFWDGNGADFSSILARWCELVGFQAGDELGSHGHIGLRSPRTNGSSGMKVLEHYLAPLGLHPDSVTFTDVYPVFVVKSGRIGSKNRGQGGAIRDEYDPIAENMRMRPSSLPPRPARALLPKLAARDFSTRLLSDLAASQADLVITLGSEVWDTFHLIPELQARAPTPTFEGLYGSRYGQTGELQVFAKKMTWLPLVHPGLLTTVTDTTGGPAEVRRTERGWNSLHANWKASRHRCLQLASR